MKHFGAIYAIAAVLLLIGQGGCRLAQLNGPFASVGPTAPTLLSPAATPADIVAAVNQNSSRVQSYTAPNASFSTPGLPGLPLLRGSIVLERPRRFRLKAGTALSGGEVDLGSNDQLFWLWAKRNEPPAVYFARHDQAGSGAARAILPIEPWWVVEALGLVKLDPAAAYQGPFPRPDGTLELRSTVAGPAGPMQRVTVVEPEKAWVVEQHVYDPNGSLVASAVAEDFRYHPVAQASLPERVTIRVPTAELSLTINTGDIAINAPIVNPDQHFALPYLEGFPQIDLGRSDGLPGLASQQAIQPTTVVTPFAPQADQLAPAVAIAPAPVSTDTSTIQRIPSGGVALPSERFTR